MSKSFLYDSNRKCQNTTSLENILENEQEAFLDKDNCVVRRVKCGHEGSILYDRKPCDYQVQSFQRPPIYHHNHHNGKRQNTKLKPLKVQ